jgi:magnesium-transporting ATPase (P-type)
VEILLRFSINAKAARRPGGDGGHNAPALKQAEIGVAIARTRFIQAVSNIAQFTTRQIANLRSSVT